MEPPVRGPVAFIGLMATGKSVVGAQLASRLGWSFIDTDQLIVARHGRISRIFSQQGEQAFRRLEARVVAEVLAEASAETVVSLGGGAVLDEGTQALLAGARVVFLDADLATVRRRITRDRSRPLLAGDPVEAWTRMDRERRPVYERLADIVLDTRGHSIDQLVTELSTQLQNPHDKLHNRKLHNRKLHNSELYNNEGDSHGE
ncbi:MULTISPECIES: shikimate kinase [unclassified Arthrobacter]|uniref:shikimate kinase n=1 Tax=unclassified Arthrobacter TaxID=235627 RepID=UPI001492D6A5|nr:MULTISPECIES: shikimate kinase [unclassified Arthrobacter]MBE0009834.1 shikimate kinase [Arthrobacter sp. AET 35A]NOJ63666.1 shikimate kinase [Arthrobacter sp. 147(2020)]